MWHTLTMLILSQHIVIPTRIVMTGLEGIAIHTLIATTGEEMFIQDIQDIAILIQIDILSTVQAMIDIILIRRLLILIVIPIILNIFREEPIHTVKTDEEEQGTLTILTELLGTQTPILGLRPETHIIRRTGIIS